MFRLAVLTVSTSGSQGQREDTNFIEVGMYHKKTNVGKLLTPKGFRITWNEGIRIESVDPMRSALLASQGKIGDRAYMALEEGVFNTIF